jgi:BRCA1/BRCA2-containing complex subunit 3
MPSKVVVKADVYRCMWTHVLSTESEEIMGMLLGEVTSDDVLVVHGLKVAQRADKRPDRVEISDLQMVKGVEAAEALSLRTGKDLRVLGWYHSHPKLTVWPSHVDLNTQLNYQGLDQHFVGIICSGFKEGAKNDSMQVRFNAVLITSN